MRLYLQIHPISCIWTGDTRRQNTRFLLANLKGSLRWWYETLIRGLNSYACDPNNGEHACNLRWQSEAEAAAFERACTTAGQASAAAEMVKKKICPACYLFGCTGWKSRLGLSSITELRNEGETLVTGPLQPGKSYRIPISERLPWFELEAEELFLLELLFAFISEHGSICARNTLLPSEETEPVPHNGQKVHKNSYRYHCGSRHGNFGLCTITLHKKEQEQNTPQYNKNGIQSWLKPFVQENQRSNHEEWPNFQCIWYSSCLLNREQIRKLVGRHPDESKKYLRPLEDPEDQWYGGNTGKSKKIFPFHSIDTHPPEYPARVWGYVCSKERISEINTESYIVRKAIKHRILLQLQCGMDYLRDKGIL